MVLCRLIIQNHTKVLNKKAEVHPLHFCFFVQHILAFTFPTTRARLPRSRSVVPRISARPRSTAPEV